MSVESSIALTFNLKNYGDVYMRVIHDPATVALDSVEITFKDQYMGRSEMWRLKQFLTNTCVYINKKIEYCESIRCQGESVNRVWTTLSCVNRALNFEFFRSLRDVVDGRASRLRSHQRGHQGRFSLVHQHGLSLHPDEL